MTTSSSSCIIKPGTGIEIVQFVPPAQSDIAPPMQKSGDKEEHAHTGKNSPAPAKRTAEPGAADVVEDAREQARQILLKANQMAGDILREAGKQAEQLKKTAIEEGCREGFEAGYKSGTEQAAMEQADFSGARKKNSGVIWNRPWHPLARQRKKALGITWRN